MKKSDMALRSAGYAFLAEKYSLKALPNWHASFVAEKGTPHKKVLNGHVEEVYRSHYWPGETDTDHLEFALKYDGVNLGLLYLVFRHVRERELAEYIRSKPSGKYARKVWFFYEFLTGRTLDIEDLPSGGYIPALEESEYYTLSKGFKRARYRVIDNLPGSAGFCPLIRKTPALLAFDSTDSRARYESLVAGYPAHLLRRASAYLFGKETKSSFEIERVTPDSLRVEKFVAALELAAREDFCDKRKLIELQNRIVDRRFMDEDYRSSQNYVGQTVSFQHEIMHYICPKPEDIHDLMAGLLRAHGRMAEGGVPPVMHAAAIAYGFVFLHPFEDGNGRIHRFLIHNILSLRGLVPEGMIFPVSAVMLKYQTLYDSSLESFSRPLLPLIEYSLDESGRMTVAGDTAYLYRFMDMTAQAEALCDFVHKTLEEELVNELGFLVKYDDAKRAMQAILDMPDRLIDLFIQFCVQNNGRVSAAKRSAYFGALTDTEIAALETAVNKSFGSI